MYHSILLEKGQVDNSCKQRVDCFYCSLVTVHTDHGPIFHTGEVSLSIPTMVRSFTQEKSACLAEVGVMEQIMQKSWANIEHVQTVCTS